MREKKKKRKKLRWKKILLIVLLFCGIVACLFVMGFRLEHMEIEGNTRYTDKEIEAIVRQNGKMDNTLVIYGMTRFRPITGIPFIDKITVTLTSPNDLEVNVYEKAIAGCVEDMGKYIYFDRDGYILESREERFPDVPCVEGLRFEQFILHEKLPIEDEDTFKEILQVTQLIRENELKIDRVLFDVTGELLLYKDDIIINLGKGDHLEEKMMNLTGILEETHNLKGVLHMEDFVSSSDMVSFTPEKTKKKKK